MASLESHSINKRSGEASLEPPPHTHTLLMSSRGFVRAPTSLTRSPQGTYRAVKRLRRVYSLVDKPARLKYVSAIASRYWEMRKKVISAQKNNSGQKGGVFLKNNKIVFFEGLTLSEILQQMSIDRNSFTTLSS